MQRFTSLKIFLLLPLIGLSSLKAQQVNSGKIISKQAKFSKKSSEELAKSHGFDRCSTVEYENYLQAKYPGRMTESQFEA